MHPCSWAKLQRARVFCFKANLFEDKQNHRIQANWPMLAMKRQRHQQQADEAAALAVVVVAAADFQVHMRGY